MIIFWVLSDPWKENIIIIYIDIRYPPKKPNFQYDNIAKTLHKAAIIKPTITATIPTRIYVYVFYFISTNPKVKMIMNPDPTKNPTIVNTISHLDPPKNKSIIPNTIIETDKTHLF